MEKFRSLSARNDIPILILILALCGTGYLMKETYAPIELNYDHVDEDNEIVEAEIMD